MRKKLVFWYICDSVFSQRKYLTCEFSGGRYGAAIRHSTQENFGRVSLPDFHETYLTREKYSLLHSHTLFMQSLFGSACVCKQ